MEDGLPCHFVHTTHILLFPEDLALHFLLACLINWMRAEVQKVVFVGRV